MEKSEKGIFAFIDYENNSIQDFKKGFFAQAIVAKEAFFICENEFRSNQQKRVKIKFYHS